MLCSGSCDCFPFRVLKSPPPAMHFLRSYLIYHSCILYFLALKLEIFITGKGVIVTSTQEPHAVTLSQEETQRLFSTCSRRARGGEGGWGGGPRTGAAGRTGLGGSQVWCLWRCIWGWEGIMMPACDHVVPRAGTESQPRGKPPKAKVLRNCPGVLRNCPGAEAPRHPEGHPGDREGGSEESEARTEKMRQDWLGAGAAGGRPRSVRGSGCTAPGEGGGLSRTVLAPPGSPPWLHSVHPPCGHRAVLLPS